MIHLMIRKDPIRIIQTFIRRCNSIYNLLPNVQTNEGIISYKDINYFYNVENKDKNDLSNKTRENIIASIINQTIPQGYFKYSNLWKTINNGVNDYLNQLACQKNLIIDSVVCMPKAGRGNHYDFQITINKDHIFDIEFKFNASTVTECPQFVSPMNPSKYLDINFEEFFYSNYLGLIAIHGKLELPDKSIYLQTIGNNNVDCMKPYKEKYDTDKGFNDYCKKIDKQAIKQFISISNLNIAKLSRYLSETQSNKIYMCYKNKVFYLDNVDPSIYTIKDTIQKKNTNYICITENNMLIELRLRFKNGCGLQFPAFQIKRKFPNVKELKELCKAHNIVAPRLKKDMINILTRHSIMI